MRSVRVAWMVAAVLFCGVPDATAQSPVVTQHRDYAFITMRRHNDIQGVEAIFDDYRRGWLRRHNSEVLVGTPPNDGVADTPRCSSIDGKRPREHCGGAHIFRSNVTAIGASDNYRGGSTRETGLLGYLGYEYLFANDVFLGFGASFATSDIDHRLGGQTLNVRTQEVGAHLVTGYLFGNGSRTAWNVSFVGADNDTVRNGNVTGTYDTVSLMVTGVWYNDRQLSDDLYLAYGIDYTFLGIWGDGGFADSSGAFQPVRDGWRGDITPSLMLVKTFDGGEAFARVGSSIEVVNSSDRPFDATLDVGGSMNLAPNIALTGTLGGSYRDGGYFEGRGSVRLVGKF